MSGTKSGKTKPGDSGPLLRKKRTVLDLIKKAIDNIWDWIGPRPDPAWRFVLGQPQ